MRVFQRWVSATFWYDLALRATIAQTLRTHGFTAEEVRQTRDRHRQLVKIHRHRIRDIPSEYHLSWSSMILAVYRQLQSQGTPDAVERTASLLFANMGPDTVAQAVGHSLDRSQDAFRTMVDTSKRQESHFYGQTFTFSRPVDHQDAYHLRVHSCFYHEFFAELGAPELMTVACRWDLISWSQGIDPARHGLAFSRPKTLGLDGQTCEFNFVRLSSGQATTPSPPRG